MVPTTTATPPPWSLAEARQQLPSLEQWAVKTLTSNDDGLSLASLIREGTAIAVSDGSHSPGHSTPGFILTRRSRKGPCVHDISGSNIVPGIPDEQDSYRAELGGAMGALATLELVCKVHNITEGSVELGFDGLVAMEAVSLPKDPRNCQRLQPSYGHPEESQGAPYYHHMEAH
jgi:hypothetical protein